MRLASKLLWFASTSLACGGGPVATDAGAGDASTDALPPLPGDAGVVSTPSIAVGLFFTCALRPGGAIACWGYNAYGMLGNGTTADSVVPVTVSNVVGALGVAAAGYDACALMPSQTVKCWGNNFYGELGTTTALTASDVPVDVPNVSYAIQVSVGTAFSCALLSNRTARCWGGIAYFEGAGDPVVGLANATVLSSGYSQTCALLVDSSMQCWGADENGQLGTGSLSPNTPEPNAVAGLENVKSMSAGTFETCALLGDGTVDCWGDNTYGELGTGQATPGQPGTPTPVAVGGVTGATAISVGEQYACAVLSDATAVCWGRNDLGMLGNGTTTSSPVPVPVSNLTSVVGIVAGSTHTCAELADGTYACWGNNQYGQLGDGTTTSSSVPVTVKL